MLTVTPWLPIFAGEPVYQDVMKISRFVLVYNVALMQLDNPPCSFKSLLWVNTLGA